MNQDHFAILKQGADAWNRWRREQPDVVPNLVGANLSGQNLRTFDFSRTQLGTMLDPASAIPGMIQLGLARLGYAGHIATNLSGSDLKDAVCLGADLRGANLEYCSLVNTDLSNANLSGCRIFGIAAWNLKLDGAVQKDLVITPDTEPRITTDSLEIAQFIYLLLNNQKIRHVIDTITAKVVLILGRFTPDRKAILDAIRDELRSRNYVPVLFDFEKPSNKSTVETVSTLAHMARFVIADLTDAKSVLQELQAIAPSNPSVPVQPLILDAQSEPGMFDFFRLLPWVLEPFVYADQDQLLGSLDSNIVGPAEAKAKEQTRRKI